jgi:hypothetical protein
MSMKSPGPLHPPSQTVGNMRASEVHMMSVCQWQWFHKLACHSPLDVREQQCSRRSPPAQPVRGLYLDTPPQHNPDLAQPHPWASLCLTCATTTVNPSSSRSTCLVIVECEQVCLLLLPSPPSISRVVDLSLDTIGIRAGRGHDCTMITDSFDIKIACMPTHCATQRELSQLVPHWDRLHFTSAALAILLL